MKLEPTLNYFTHNVESIIQWLFLFILALTGLLITRGLTKKPEEGASSNSNSNAYPAMSRELESVLNQILERTTKLESVSVQGMSAESVALAETQVQALKKELASRDEELKALKSTSAGAKVNEEAEKLASRLKELESKLAEYEILEDDIADLSLYKEENARLRAELDKKGGGSAAAPAPPAAAAASAPPPPAPEPESIAEPEPIAVPEPSDLVAEAAPEPREQAAAVAPEVPAADIVAEFAEAIGDEPAVSAQGPVTIDVPETGNPMEDFEAAVKLEKQMQEKIAAKPPAAERAAPAAARAVAKADSDDLFAEFSEPPVADPSALDTDKMMAEMASLVGLEPATGSALDDGIDTDKMAAEAGSLQKR